MHSQTLIDTAHALTQSGRGLLAADESFPTIEKRFNACGIESTEDSRRDYREMLIGTDGVEEFISGVILFEETLFQNGRDGTPLVKMLENKGIIPGIKVDKGCKPLPFTDGEKVTEGLDGLRDRLARYREAGARFAKWRAMIAISDGLPSDHCVNANAHALARYAALCQEAEIVPIVEPEVLIDGGHDLATGEAATQRTLAATFKELAAQRVMLEGLLLKPNLVLPGKDSPQQASVEQVAEATSRCFKRVVPAAVPGVVFLSGGQPEQAATAHLNAINQIGPHPWTLTFSFARALQTPAMEIWGGKSENTAAARRAFYHRAQCNSAAARGQYAQQMEDAA